MVLGFLGLVNVLGLSVDDRKKNLQNFCDNFETGGSVFLRGFSWTRICSNKDRDWPAAIAPIFENSSSY